MSTEVFLVMMLALFVVGIILAAISWRRAVVFQRDEISELKTVNEQLERFVERLEERICDLEKQAETLGRQLMLTPGVSDADDTEGADDEADAHVPGDDLSYLCEYLSPAQMEKWEVLNASLKKDEERKKKEHSGRSSNAISDAELDALLGCLPMLGKMNGKGEENVEESNSFPRPSTELEPDDSDSVPSSSNTISIDELLALAAAKPDEAVRE